MRVGWIWVGEVFLMRSKSFIVGVWNCLFCWVDVFVVLKGLYGWFVFLWFCEDLEIMLVELFGLRCIMIGYFCYNFLDWVLWGVMFVC